MRRTSKNVYVSPRLSTTIIRVCCLVCAWRPLRASGQDSLWQWEVCPAPSCKEKDRTRGEAQGPASRASKLPCSNPRAIPWHPCRNLFSQNVLYITSLHSAKAIGCGAKGHLLKVCSLQAARGACSGAAHSVLALRGSGSPSSDVAVEEWRSGAIRRTPTVTR